MDQTPKRKIPDEALIKWRTSYLNSMRGLQPIKREGNIIGGLELGNNKTGISGKKFDTIFVWNLPAVVTCPGATAWCLRYCYNADIRFPTTEWQRNWHDCLYRKDHLKARINSQLNKIENHCAVRIHSSGDFFNNDYIRFWISIIQDNPHIQFWAYTRSWRCSKLKDQLNKLQNLGNMQIFASIDSSTLNASCPSWRKSFIEESTNGRHHDGISCPEQFSNTIKCADCGVCIADRDDNVIFLPH